MCILTGHIATPNILKGLLGKKGEGKEGGRKGEKSGKKRGKKEGEGKKEESILSRQPEYLPQ